jgi:two-component system chemotaxis response regulator CheY
MALRDRLRVLVVDDMATSRGLITQALEGFGIRNVASASDGKSALATIDQNPVHLVISDYDMPGMDGLRLLHILRQGQRTEGIGFLLVTGTQDPDVFDHGCALGMNNYLKKPFLLADLRQAIEAVVGRL